MSVEVPTTLFRTHNLFFAAWLLCGRAPYHQHRVSFLRIEPMSAERRTKVFVFSDPDGEAPELEREFKANPPVRVLTLKNAYNFLRERMKDLDRPESEGGAR